MRVRTALRREWKIVSYLAIFVVLLSIGLRVYCAWHIPKAKRLLADVSQLRATQSFDKQVHYILSEYDFRAVDADNCSIVACEYAGGFGVPYPYVYGSVSDQIADASRWFIDRMAVPLGFHPWRVSAILKIKSGRLASFTYEAFVMDPTGIGVGASFKAQ